MDQKYTCWSKIGLFIIRFSAVIVIIFIIILYKKDSFQQELTDKTHNKYIEQGDVLVKYYAPWCHYCNEFDPKFKKIGKLLKGKIKTAKLNADKYEMKFVESYPTLIFYPKNGDPIKYDGERSIKKIIEFIEKN